MDSKLKTDIYFVIKPMYYISKILGIAAFKIYKENESVNKYHFLVSDIILPVFMIIVLCLCSYASVIYAMKFDGREVAVNIRVVWISYIIISRLTSIFTLLMSVTVNKHYIPQALRYLSYVDRKLFEGSDRENIFRQGRTFLVQQLTVTILVTALDSAFFTYVFPPSAPVHIMHVISEVLCATISKLMVLQYVNLVFLLKQRYKYINSLLSEVLTTNNISTSRHQNGISSISQRFNPLLNTTKPNIYTSDYGMNNIRYIRIIFIQLYEALSLINKYYGILIFLYTVSTLVYSTPAFYLTVVILRNAISSYGDGEVYLKGALLVYLCVSNLILFLWLIVCCHQTTEELHRTPVHVQKLHLLPNIGSRFKSELNSFCFQLRDVKVEFNICGVFTLNLHFLCGVLSIVFTNILVLVQLN
jgi:hypothetical protein